MNLNKFFKFFLIFFILIFQDNFNNEWWLLEKLKKETEIKQRGYVPSNYVELIYSDQINQVETAIDTLEYPIEFECEKRGIKC